MSFFNVGISYGMIYSKAFLYDQLCIINIPYNYIAINVNTSLHISQYFLMKTCIDQA